MISHRSRVLAWALAVATFAPAPARAQIATLLDPSARAGGMGGASSAVAWSGPPNVWANPALVSAAPGFSAQVTSEQLVPGFANDVWFNTTRLTVAFAGLAYTNAGRPLGANDLDYGAFESSFGVIPAGTERVWEHGFGVSAASLADALMALTGRPVRVSDWGDVAWGRQWKRDRTDIAVETGRGSARDEGWLVRFAPVDSRRGMSTPEGGARVELAYAHAVINDRQDPVYFPLEDVSNDFARGQRDAGALRFAWYGPERDAEPGAALTDVFRGGLGPLVELTLAYDRERTLLRGFPSDKASRYGLEATWLRVLTTRFGYVDDRDGGITKPSWGLGACLPVSRNSEVRYDFASAPQSAQHRVYRHEIAVRVDPLTRWFGLQPSSEPR
jgi:hypothetical protein